MDKNPTLSYKTLVIGVIVLFIGVGISPSTGNINTKSSQLCTPLCIIESNEPPVADAGGPYFGYINIEILFNGSGSYDPDGKIKSYEWDFGDGTNGSGETTPHIYYYPGEYIVMLTIADEEGYIDNDTTTATIYSRLLPRPEIDGPSIGKVDIEYNYTIISFNPDCDPVFYWIDWGDETNTSWIGPYSPHKEITVNKTWKKIGFYTIKAKVKTIFDAESDWTTFLVFIIRARENQRLLLHLLLERISILEKLFYLIMIK